MNRIFLTVSLVSNLFLAVTYALGWSVRDLTVAGSTGVDLSVHFLCGVAALTVAMLVHAIVLTYFMGTGRWIEETTAAYALGPDARNRNIQLKYRTLPGMIGCLLLLIVVGALGAASDPGAALDFPAAATIHMVLATAGLLTNIIVSVIEWDAIGQNGQLIAEIMEQVHSIRRERGLDLSRQPPNETTQTIEPG